MLDALAAIVHLPESASMPGWLDGTINDGLLTSARIAAASRWSEQPGALHQTCPSESTTNGA